MKKKGESYEAALWHLEHLVGSGKVRVWPRSSGNRTVQEATDALVECDPWVSPDDALPASPPRLRANTIFVSDFDLSRNLSEVFKKRRQPRNPAVAPLIAEGAELVRRGMTMNAAAKLIDAREWPKNEKLAQTQGGLVDQIRRGISDEIG